jgi:general secretion pathway protein D
MGGLTRDEVRTINDKVPFLGDIPGLGRLFRSEGETRQKRNLLIFVTANLVSPGGSLTNQSYDKIKSNTIYQSPAQVIPAGNNFRNVTISE